MNDVLESNITTLDRAVAFALPGLNVEAMSKAPAQPQSTVLPSGKRAFRPASWYDVEFDGFGKNNTGYVLMLHHDARVFIPREIMRQVEDRIDWADSLKVRVVGKRNKTNLKATHLKIGTDVFTLKAADARLAETKPLVTSTTEVKESSVSRQETRPGNATILGLPKKGGFGFVLLDNGTKAFVPDNLRAKLKGAFKKGARVEVTTREAKLGLRCTLISLAEANH